MLRFHSHHHQRSALTNFFIANSINTSLPFVSSFTTLRHCSAKMDAPGGSRETKSDYQPRVRPRNLIMPIDFDDLHNAERTLGKDGAYLMRQASLRKQTRGQPTVKLGELPEEHTFADMFSAVLENVKKREEMIKKTKEATENADFNSDAMNMDKLRKKTFQEEPRITQDANSAFLDLSLMETNDDNSTSSSSSNNNDNSNNTSDVQSISNNNNSDLLAPTAYQVWDALEQVQVASPFGGGLGVLSSSGYSLIQLEVTSYITHLYPRLRSRHIETLLHSVVGYQPMVRLGLEIGLVSLCRLETDAGLWKELCNLHQREHHLRQMYYHHKTRFEAGDPANKVDFYHRQLRWVGKKTKLFPTDASTLLPRIEWIRNTVLGFVGWLELSEGEEAAKKFVRDKICSLFDNDEDEVFGEHPEEAKQLRASHRKSTTSNTVGAEPFEDPIEKYNRRMLSHLACRRVVDAVHPNNALKEAQLILNYSPFVPREKHFVLVSAEDNVFGDEKVNDDDDDEKMKKKKVVKFDIRIRATTAPILQSDTLSSNIHNPEEEASMSTKCYEADLIVFEKSMNRRNSEEDEIERVIGTGIGMTEQESMQACCLDFVRRYYFTKQ